MPALVGLLRFMSTRIAALIVAIMLICGPATAETWTPLQFRQPMPIPYLVDIDGLRIEGSRRSLPAKWTLAPDLYALGSWQFDCRSRTWRAGGAFTVVRSGAARPVSQPAVWRAAKAGSPTDQLMAITCSAPSTGSRDWLAQQLLSAHL